MKQLNSHQFEGIYKTLDINLDKLGCVMLDLEPLENMWSIELDGAGTALYYSKNPNRKWIDGWVCDKVPHITLLYGLLDNAHNWENLIDMALWDWKLEEVEINHISYFDSPYEDEPYYCIVAHIKVTDELMEGHQRLELLPHINTFTGYKPHMTICYLEKKQDQAQSEQYRDTMIEHFNKCFAGKKLKVKDHINFGYEPEKATDETRSVGGIAVKSIYLYPDKSNKGFVSPVFYTENGDKYISETGGWPPVLNLWKKDK